MISITNLTKKFAGITAVKNVSFDVPKGQITGLLGVNGAGKTTILRVLSGFIAPTAGEVVIGGLSLGEHSVAIRKKIGYLPENARLYPEMRVKEYLVFRARLKGLPRSKLKPRLEAVCSICALDEVFGRIIGNLSKGYWQRIALADCLIHEPEILILDEPTISLDPNQTRVMRETIRDLAGTYTIVLSTHLLNEAETLCRQVLILDQGQVLAMDTPENLINLSNPNFSVIIEIDAPPEAAKAKLCRLAGVEDILLKTDLDRSQEEGKPVALDWYCYELQCEQATDLRPAIFQEIKAQGWSLRELRSGSKRLEDVFFKLTSR